MQSDLKIKGAETTRDSVIQQQFDESKIEISHANNIKETEKSVLYEIYSNRGVFKAWIPKSSDKSEKAIINLIKKIRKMEEYEIVKETALASCVKFFQYNIWIPKSVWLNYPKKEYNVERWILQNKFEIVDRIQYETEQAILFNGVWIPKVCLIELNDIRYVPIWKLEKKGGSNGK